MMAQNVRARRPQVVASDIGNTKSENETFQKKFAKYIVQFSVLGLISIIIFYSVRFIYVGLFHPKSATESNPWESATSADLEEMGIYWSQPVISLDSIPNNIFTTSTTDECKTINSEWNMKSFTYQEAIDIVKKELDLNDIDLTKIKEPTDLFKYVIINKYGGFYIDQKAECKDSIDEWIQFYYPIKHIHYNNYILTYQLLTDDKMNKFVNLDMIIAFESSMPYAFANWAFFTKPNNPIIHFIIDSYLDFIQHKDNDNKIDKTVKQMKDIYVGPNIFTEAIVGFVDAFTNDRDQALTFHKFEDGKGHIITLYMNEKGGQQGKQQILEKKENNEDIINILVVPLPDLWEIAKRKNPNLKFKQ